MPQSSSQWLVTDIIRPVVLACTSEQQIMKWHSAYIPGYSGSDHMRGEMIQTYRLQFSSIQTKMGPDLNTRRMNAQTRV